MIMKSSSVCAVALMALVVSSVRAFMSVGGNGNTHVTITSKAIMMKINEVCKAVAESERRDFKPKGTSAEEVLRACVGTDEVSGATFLTALNQIYMQNGFVDRDFMSSAPHHFNNEAFNEGWNLIIQGTAAVKANVRTNNLLSARETLGRVCHTLQDFYSHSNWVELGNKSPYTNLIRPDLSIENIADITMPTCSDCASGSCSNLLLPAVLNGKYLTSGYMGLFSSHKPQGKCSHGGDSDLSNTQNPRGGISKDDSHSYDADLHNTAVKLATEATLELLEDIRGSIGNKDYLRLMGIARSLGLAFVIEMGTDIPEIKKIAYKVIDSKKGTRDEPSEYILVPFGELEFGPIIRTTDPDVMKSEISKLSSNGGGKRNLCLSALQLALTGAPSSSNIYVFTNYPPKDIGIEKTIISLIRSTKSTVSFFISLSLRTMRQRRWALQAQPRSKFQMYYDVALPSGGQVIEFYWYNLPQATDLIVETSTSALVTILQCSRSPGRVESFPFLVDYSVSNVIIYIIGNRPKFTLHNPSGKSQSSVVTDGILGTIQKVGNLNRFQLKIPEPGLWNIDMESTQSYTIKVNGQSRITFIYDFVEEFKGPHPGYLAIYGQPPAGFPIKLLLTLTGNKGPDVLEVQEVALIEVSGLSVSNGTIEKMSDRDFLVTVKEVPEGEFVVLLKGKDLTTQSLFQRQITTQMSQSNLSIRVMADESMQAGQEFNLNFTLTTNGTSGVYNIRANNNKDFKMNHTSKLNLVSGGSASGKVSLNLPANTVPGTDVTLTIDAEGPGGVDSNFVMLGFSVIAKVTDFTRPQCKVIGVQGDCSSSSCKLSNWELSINITDNGTGVESVSVQEGSGKFTQKQVEEGGVTMVMGHYEASCCSPSITLSTVDKVGNIGRCTYKIDTSAGSALVSMTLLLWACLLTSSMSLLRDTLCL